MLDNLSTVRYCEQEYPFLMQQVFTQNVINVHVILLFIFCILVCVLISAFTRVVQIGLCYTFIQMSNIRSLHLSGYRSLQVIKSSSACWPISSNPQKSGNEGTRLLFGEKLLFSRISLFLTSALCLYVLLCK